MNDHRSDQNEDSYEKLFQEVLARVQGTVACTSCTADCKKGYEKYLYNCAVLKKIVSTYAADIRDVHHRLRTEIEEHAQMELELGTQAKALAAANERSMRTERVLIRLVRDVKQAQQELKNTQDKLLHSEKLASIGLLAAGVAHEINNPLSFIQSNNKAFDGYAQHFIESLAHAETLLNALERGDGDAIATAAAEMRSFQQRYDCQSISEDIANLSRETGEGIDRIKKIVNSLRVYAEPSQNVAPENINHILEGIVPLLSTELANRITVRTVFGEIPEVVCNAQQLSQVFVCMLVNAAQAIDGKGVIDIVTECVAGAVRVRIRDTGKGIAPEVLPKIFDPFFTTKEIGTGTGLGLSISYDIIRKHSGTIEVNSTPGRGTEFVVLLPQSGGA